MQQTPKPNRYISKEVSASTYANIKLEEAVTLMCNEMLEEGYIYVDSIASIQQMSAVLLFAKYE